MNIGDIVRIDKCEQCAGVIGKTVRIKSMSEDGKKVELNYGKGRPLSNRPNFLSLDDVSLVDNKE